MLTPEQAIKRLEDHIKPMGKKKDAAAILGVPSVNLSQMLHGKRPLAGAVMDALGLERADRIMYREKKDTPANA